MSPARSSALTAARALTPIGCESPVRSTRLAPPPGSDQRARSTPGQDCAVARGVRAGGLAFGHRQLYFRTAQVEEQVSEAALDPSALNLRTKHRTWMRRRLSEPTTS